MQVCYLYDTYPHNNTHTYISFYGCSCVYTCIFSGYRFLATRNMTDSKSQIRFNVSVEIHYSSLKAFLTVCADAVK